MKRYCLIRRNDRQGAFYSHDLTTGKRKSLGTKDREEAERLINAKNDALKQPHFNLQLAKVYLSGADEKLIKRTWAEVFDSRIEMSHGVSRARWVTAKKDKAFAPILEKRLIETTADDLLQVLKVNKVSTTIHLRKIHNLALDMDWLPRGIIPKRRWPAVVYQEKRAITLEEHNKILAGEQNPEWKAFYRLLWHVGGSQSDIACLNAEDVNWEEKIIIIAPGYTWDRCAVSNPPQAVSSSLLPTILCIEAL